MPERTDRELLELAAKAAGKRFVIEDEIGFAVIDEYGFPVPWNPLDDDGDALRLSVKLRIHPILRNLGCDATDGNKSMAYERFLDDEYAATRRAIVRAAAEIGANMQS